MEGEGGITLGEDSPIPLSSLLLNPTLHFFSGLRGGRRALLGQCAPDPIAAHDHAASAGIGQEKRVKYGEWAVQLCQEDVVGQGGDYGGALGNIQP